MKGALKFGTPEWDEAVGKFRGVPPVPERTSKYNARKVETEDGVFDSKKEHAHWRQLKARERAGEIKVIERQVRFPLVVNEVKIGAYILDFRYAVVETGAVVHEDVKGMKKGAAYAAFHTKKKLMLALYGIDVIEI